MACIFVAGGLSMWDDLEGVTERRVALPGPVAVLNNCFEGKREIGTKATSLHCWSLSSGSNITQGLLRAWHSILSPI
jgi:hypothetical protein